MKKLIVFLIILSFLTVNSKIGFVLAQEDENDQRENIQQKISQFDFTPYYLQCKIPKHIEIEEIESTTSSVDYISEFEYFSGKEQKPPGFFEELIRGFIVGIAADLISGLFKSLIGKVPVAAQEVNADIKNSLKETTKNIAASIKASIQLAIKDAIEYFKFKLISKINDFIYNKILKNFISDINLYRNFRLFLAQQKALNRVLNKYKNLLCIPDDLRWCLANILTTTQISGASLASQSENSQKLMKYFDVFMKLQKLNILEKKACEPEEEIIVYKNLNIQPPVNETMSESWGEFGGPEYAFHSKPKKLITKIETRSLNAFANIFNLVKVKNLLAQFYPTENLPSFTTIIFPYIEKINTEISLKNCSFLISRDMAVIESELSKELEKLNIEEQQPGGLTFKPKSMCLKTWSEVEKEEIMNQIKNAMEKGDTKKVEELDRKKQSIEQRIEAEKNISGEDPRCLMPGPILSSPSDYEKLKEQILTSPLDFFKSQERAANVLAAFLRSWFSTKLFQIIDKGFASLESKKTKNEIILDIKNAYTPEKINQVCSKTEYLNTPGLTQACKDTLESQLAKTAEISQEEFKVASKKLTKILSKITDISNETEQLASTTRAFSEALNEYIENQNLSFSDEKLTNLEHLISSFNNNLENLNQINSLLPTSTIEELTQLKNTLYNATITQLKIEIDSTSKRVQEIEKRIEKNIKEINSKTFQLFNLGYNSKLTTFFADYPDMKNLIKNSNRCNRFPAYYIFYYDEVYGKQLQIAGDCVYKNNDPFGYPQLKNEIKLTFYKKFYPTHLFYVSNSNLDYNWIKKRYEENMADLIGDRYYELIPGYNNRYVSLYLIAHDLLIILYSLYGTPPTTLEQSYFLNSLNTHINNLLMGNLDPSQLSAIQDEISKVLIPYFEKIEIYANNTIQYAKNHITPAGTLLYDFNFRYSAEEGNLNRAIVLKLGETLEYLKDLSSKYKAILNDINNLILTQGTEMAELANLKRNLDELNEALEKELNKAWDMYLSKLNEEEISKISNELDNNVEQLNNIMDENYNLCKEYNDLLSSIEEELKTTQPKESPTLPPEEPTSQMKGTPKISLIRKAFDITVNLLASIFNIFNIFKPKKIYIK